MHFFAFYLENFTPDNSFLHRPVTNMRYGYRQLVPSLYPPNLVWPCYLLPSVKVYLPSCLSAVKLRLEPQTHELLEVKDSVGWDGIII